MKPVITNPYSYYCIPKRPDLLALIKLFQAYYFPGFFSQQLEPAVVEKEIAVLLERMINCSHHIASLDIDDAKVKTQAFLQQLEAIGAIIEADLQATFDGDPAARDLIEIVLTYPGFYATFIHRLAHPLAKLDVPYLPRILNEIAHEATAIDINPSAEIGPAFMIDHGSGVVIGETAVIGSHVRIYQGVTLGALSLGRGQRLKGEKRHPTIGDHVIIYSNATILGGDTFIGDHVTIGANTMVLKSVPAQTVVRLSDFKHEFIVKHKG